MIDITGVVDVALDPQNQKIIKGEADEETNSKGRSPRKKGSVPSPGRDPEKIREVLYLYNKIPRNESSDWGATDQRVEVVRRIETILKKEFNNTRELTEFVQVYVIDIDNRKLPLNQRLRRARKKQKLSQRELAKMFGFKTHVSIAQFELGKRMPTKAVLGWLESVEMSQKKAA